MTGTRFNSNAGISDARRLLELLLLSIPRGSVRKIDLRLCGMWSLPLLHSREAHHPRQPDEPRSACRANPSIKVLSSKCAPNELVGLLRTCRHGSSGETQSEVGVDVGGRDVSKGYCQH